MYVYNTIITFLFIYKAHTFNNGNAMVKFKIMYKHISIPTCFTDTKYLKSVCLSWELNFH